MDLRTAVKNRELIIVGGWTPSKKYRPRRGLAIKKVANAPAPGRLRRRAARWRRSVIDRAVTISLIRAQWQGPFSQTSFDQSLLAEFSVVVFRFANAIAVAEENFASRSSTLFFVGSYVEQAYHSTASPRRR